MAETVRVRAPSSHNRYSRVPNPESAGGTRLDSGFTSATWIKADGRSYKPDPGESVNSHG